MPKINLNSQYQQNSVFWIELDKIKPNPLQPRREFDENQLRELAESIKMYGLLQPLVVIRKEFEIDTGTKVEYELISGERRLRACKAAGLLQAPVIIRKEPPERVKLELALVENIQRENLNTLDKARAFKKLSEEFGMTHREIAQKIGKSREVVSNTIRILNLPENIQQGIAEGRISEGHSRPLLMLQDKPEAQEMLYKDIIYRKFNVHEAEKTARRIAIERARKLDDIPDPETRYMEKRISDIIGTPVSIIKQGVKGRIHIDFFSEEELRRFLRILMKARENDFFGKEMKEIADAAGIPGEFLEKNEYPVKEISFEEKKISQGEDAMEGFL